jgi:antitoxin ParD1/3/4
MNVSIGDHLTSFVEDIVKSGRYASASEVVREGLRLVEEREAKLQSLRDTINASIAEGGSFTDDEVGAYLAEQSEKLAEAGY